MRFVLAFLGVEFLRVEFGPERGSEGQESLFEIVSNSGGDFAIADGYEDADDEDEIPFGFAL